MRRGQKKTKKTTLRSERSSALKKDLTGPTLLEMSGNPTHQALTKLCARIRNYCNFAYSALASFRMGMSGVSVFPECKEVLIRRLSLGGSPCMPLARVS